MRLVAVGGGRRRWEVDGDSSPNKSFRGRFLTRDDNVRSDTAVGDVGGTVLGSFISNSKDKASDVVEEGLVL